MADQQTLAFYSQHAEELFQRYESIVSPLIPLFEECFASSASVLDIGCGSSRDVRALLKCGYDAYGIEPSDALRKQADNAYPELKGRLSPGILPNVRSIGRFEGIICCAVLMHLPADQHILALRNIRELLQLRGRLLVSIPDNRHSIGALNRDAHGRLFESIDENLLIQQAKHAQLLFLKRFNNQDGLKRPGVSWSTLLFEAV